MAAEQKNVVARYLWIAEPTSRAVRLTAARLNTSESAIVQRALEMAFQLSEDEQDRLLGGIPRRRRAQRSETAA
jgi:hypothetical protein